MISEEEHIFADLAKKKQGNVDNGNWFIFEVADAVSSKFKLKIDSYDIWLSIDDFKVQKSLSIIEVIYSILE